MTPRDKSAESFAAAGLGTRRGVGPVLERRDLAERWGCSEDELALYDAGAADGPTLSAWRELARGASSDLIVAAIKAGLSTEHVRSFIDGARKHEKLAVPSEAWPECVGLAWALCWNEIAPGWDARTVSEFYEGRLDGDYPRRVADIDVEFVGVLAAHKKKLDQRGMTLLQALGEVARWRAWQEDEIAEREWRGESRPLDLGEAMDWTLCLVWLDEGFSLEEAWMWGTSHFEDPDEVAAVVAFLVARGQAEDTEAAKSMIVELLPTVNQWCNEWGMVAVAARLQRTEPTEYMEYPYPPEVLEWLAYGHDHSSIEHWLRLVRIIGEDRLFGGPSLTRHLSLAPWKVEELSREGRLELEREGTTITAMTLRTEPGRLVLHCPDAPALEVERVDGSYEAYWFLDGRLSDAAQ